MNVLRSAFGLSAGPVISSLLLSVASARATVLVGIGQNFTSSTYGINTPFLPPDSDGAVGPRHFVEFINGTFAIYNKTNGQSVKRISDKHFWSDAGVLIPSDAAVSDPRILYDPTVQRWFASQVDFNSTTTDPTLEANDFLLAVSAGNDPTGPWHGFLFQAEPDTGKFADFPTLGVDGDAVYLSGDIFYGMTNDPVGAALVSIPKADLVASTPIITNRTWFGVMSYDDRGQVLQPVVCVDGSSRGNVLAVGDVGADSNLHSNLVCFVVHNAAGPGATLSSATTISVSPYVVPLNTILDPPQGEFAPVQPDGTSNLDGNDARFNALVYGVGGVLYAVHCTEVNNRIAIRWYRINATNHTMLESGTIAHPNLDLFFPSIAANNNGVVVIGCNGCSLTTFVSCYAIVGETINGVTTFGNPLLLQSGVASYHGDDELLAELLDEPPISRWGDYSATSVDPSDPTRFWTIQMYPSDENVWSTQVTELLTTQQPRLTIAPAGTNVQVTWPGLAAGFQLQSTTNFSPSNTWSLVAQTPSTNGNQLSVLIPSSGAQKYFRLKQGP